MLRYVEEQLALDVVLPGTPREPVNVRDVAVFRALGLSGILADWQRVTRDAHGGGGGGEQQQQQLQRAEYVRRRRAPRSAAEACAYGNLPALVLQWAQGRLVVAVPPPPPPPTTTTTTTLHGTAATTTAGNTSTSVREVYEGSDASPLMWAAYRRHLPLVRFLVDHGADVNACNSLGHSVLQWAVYGGSADVVRYLLDHGADAARRDCQGHDAAFSAAQRGALALLLLLTEDARQAGVAQAQLTAPRPHLRLPPVHRELYGDDNDNNNSSTAVLLGATAHDAQQHLLQGGASEAGASSSSLMVTTLLHPATQKPYYVLDPSLRDVEGHSLLHWAAYSNHAAMCAYLIDYWAYDVNAVDYSGRSALVWAAREGYAEVLECLLVRGARTEVCDEAGCTAMQYARLRRHHEAVYVLRELPPARARANNGGGGALTTSSSPLTMAGDTTSTHAAASVTTPITVAHTFNEHNNSNSSTSSHSHHHHNSSGGGGSVGIVVSSNSSGCHDNNDGDDNHDTTPAWRLLRYTPVRERRACGTLRMMRQHVLFAVMALLGPLTLLGAAVSTALLPPMFSYVPSTAYLFKNAAWTSLLGTPERGAGKSGGGDNSSDSSSSSGGGCDGDVIDTEVSYASGLAKHLADALRGPWLYRLRDPANLCALVLLPFAQLYAWTALGLTPVLFAAPAPGTSGLDLSVLRYREYNSNHHKHNCNHTTATAAAAAAQRDNDNTTLATARLRDVRTYAGGAALSFVFASSTTMVPCVLLLLLTACMTTLVLCKLCERRACVPPACEGGSSGSSGGAAKPRARNASGAASSSSLSASVSAWSKSPLWRIVASRRFAWLHPRAFMVQRHVQLPLRCFYCRERDVLVRGYDGYSIALDSPIGAHNRVYFVLCVTFFALFELTLLSWGLTELSVRMQCPSTRASGGGGGGNDVDVLACASPLTYTRCGAWYDDAWHGVRSVDYLRQWAWQQQRHLYTPDMSPHATTADDALVLPASMTLLTTSVLDTAMNVLLRGLPTRMCDYTFSLTAAFVQQFGASAANTTTTTNNNNAAAAGAATAAQHRASYAPLLRVSFLLQYYVRPTLANAYGVWVLHFSLVAFVCAAFVCVRQWTAVWRGVTCIELANPFAPSTPHGDLVSIFPAATTTTAGSATAYMDATYRCRGGDGGSSNSNKQTATAATSSSTTTTSSSAVAAAVAAATSSASSGSQGDKVATVVPPYDANEEAYYRAVAPAYARPSPLHYSQCSSSSKSIFATSRYGVVNVLAFLLGVDGHRWRDAMAVSSRNTPDTKPLRAA